MAIVVRGAREGSPGGLERLEQRRHWARGALRAELHAAQGRRQHRHLQGTDHGDGVHTCSRTGEKAIHAPAVVKVNPGAAASPPRGARSPILQRVFGATSTATAAATNTAPAPSPAYPRMRTG